MKTQITARGLDIRMMVSGDKVEQQHNRWLNKYLGKRGQPAPQAQISAQPQAQATPPMPPQAQGGY